ncbi:MAG: triose-phosphate isomerase, partial [bacterium]|nr:triose-phosphate isomerase [bacterium]
MKTERKKIVLANWKMHLSVGQASLLLKRYEDNIDAHRSLEIVVAPSPLSLQPLSVQIDRRKFRLASQNAHEKDEGALMGEVSFAMMQDLVHYGIVGHSARRIYAAENLEVVRDKVAAAVRNGVIPILCVGETKHERLAKETRQVLHDQIVTALANLTAEEVAGMVIAYEPVWAISTFDGELAKPDVVAKEMAYIRNQVSELYGNEIAEEVRVIYGGSVDDHDARAYLEIEGCDGVLVG